MIVKHRYDKPIFSFDEAFLVYQELAEAFGHIQPVQLVYYKGGFDIFYYTYED